MNASVETIFKGVEDLNPRVPIADLVTRARFEAERDKIFRPLLAACRRTSASCPKSAATW